MALESRDTELAHPDQGTALSPSSEMQEVLALFERLRQNIRAGNPNWKSIVEKMKAGGARSDSWLRQKQVEHLTEVLQQGSDEEALDTLITWWREAHERNAQKAEQRHLARSATSEAAVPKPFSFDAVGVLKHDGHDVLVWSLVTTREGRVILLNCTGPDTSVSACLMKLIKSKNGTVSFAPSTSLPDPWRGPTELMRADCSYVLLRAALPEVRMKNHCLLARMVHVAEGLKRPELPPETQTGEQHSTLSQEARTVSALEPRARYIVASDGAERPPKGTLYANLRAKHIVCLPDWEVTLWEQGIRSHLIRSLPALGVTAWELDPDLKKWTGLVKQGCDASWWILPQP